MKNKILVDIIVSNCKIAALKPETQIINPVPMPNDDAGKILFWNTINTVDMDRVNKRQFGYLKGAALRKAQKIVDKYGGINISCEYVWFNTY